MKRFWTDATVDGAPCAWSVALDGRPVRVPGGGVLTLPTRALADAVAGEWRAAGGGPGAEIGYDALPLTRVAGTAQERVAPDPDRVAAEIARFGASDLLCYRATTPASLVARQEAAWQPWLDWAAARFGAHLRVTAGVGPLTQEAEALARLSEAVRAQSVAGLAGLGVVVPALGSLVLGLAVAEGALDAAIAYPLSVLDETAQEEAWGADAQAAARRAAIRDEVVAAGRYMRLAADAAAP